MSPLGPDEFVADVLARSRELSRRADEWYAAYEGRINEIADAVRAPVRIAAEWIDANREQINAFVEGLAAFDRAIKQIEAEWKDAGLGYLVSPLGAGEQLFLTLYAEPGHAEELFAFMEDALADARFVTEACDALDGAGVLSDVSRQHLQHGLRHLGEHEVIDAWPPLIIGLEGAFVDVAITQGIAVRVGNHVHLVDANGDPVKQKVPSVEGVAALLGHDDDEFGDFLVRQVYGGEGNPFRHGSAQDGIRDRAICLAVAVIGWLDAFVAPGSLDLLSRAVMEELAKRDEAQNEAEDGTVGAEASTN